jgi:hypothetical protein
MLNVPSENMSMRAKFFCKQWGAEKVAALCAQGERNRMRASLGHWRSTVAFHFNMVRLSLYLRFTSCRKLELLLAAFVRRVCRRAVRAWQRECRRQRREEADSAACECQRPARAFLAKRKVTRARRNRAALMVQCMFRVAKAIVECKARIRKKREDGAARVIQKEWRRSVACGLGRAEAERRRKGRRINLVQRKWRDYVAIKVCSSR